MAAIAAIAAIADGSHEHGKHGRVAPIIHGNHRDSADSNWLLNLLMGVLPGSHVSLDAPPKFPAGLRAGFP